MGKINYTTAEINRRLGFISAIADDIYGHGGEIDKGNPIEGLGNITFSVGKDVVLRIGAASKVYKRALVMATLYQMQENRINDDRDDMGMIEEPVAIAQELFEGYYESITNTYSVSMFLGHLPEASDCILSVNTISLVDGAGNTQWQWDDSQDELFVQFHTNTKGIVSGIIPTTYTELKGLRDSGRLQPGSWYRLTDYDCTTTQGGTRCAGHRFDLLIHALDNHTLGEECKACLNEEYENKASYIFMDDALKCFFTGEKIHFVFDDCEKDLWYWETGSDEIDVANFYCGFITELSPIELMEKGDIDHEFLYFISSDEFEKGTTVDLGVGDFATFKEDMNFDEYLANLSVKPSFGYFSKSHLEAWKVWYCIDNDETRFGWADDNGKGVIYRMIDEHRNDVPYDFKNIQFKRWKGIDNTEDEVLYSLTDTWCIADINSVPKGMSVDDEDIYIWLYTFSLHINGMEATDVYQDTEIFDETVFIANHSVLNDEGLEEECHDNKFGAYYGSTKWLPDEIAYQGQTQFLNNNTFLLGCENNGDDYYSDYAYGIYGNEFGVDCHNNSIGSGFNNNSIGSGFNYNSIGSDFNHNSIGSYFNYNSIGSYFYHNSIGSEFNSNSIGNSFYRNSIGSGFNYNSIGSYFNYNSIGSYFYHNSIGSEFNSNSIGSEFNSNSIGSYFNYNSIGSGFNYNSIGNYVRQTTINDGVTYVNIAGGSNNRNYVQNCHIFNGTQGVSNSNKLLITFQMNKKYTQFAALNDEENLDIWTR